jgi:hypothetical protein
LERTVAGAVGLLFKFEYMKDIRGHYVSIQSAH